MSLFEAGPPQWTTEGSPEVSEQIEAQLEAELASLREESPDEAEIWEGILRDRHESLYHYLMHLKTRTGIDPSTVLYPGEMEDTIPELVYGPGKITRVPLPPRSPSTGDYQSLADSPVDLSLDFPDGSFQAIILSRLPDDLSLRELNEFSRVLAEDGWIIHAEMNHMFVQSWDRKKQIETARHFIHEDPKFAWINSRDTNKVDGNPEKGDSESMFFVFLKKPAQEA